MDPLNLTAKEVWNFDYGKTILSDICSSVYEAPEKSLLVNYSVANSRSKSRVEGLDVNRNISFEFEYSVVGYSTNWNAIPIALESMSFS